MKLGFFVCIVAAFLVMGCSSDQGAPSGNDSMESVLKEAQKNAAKSEGAKGNGRGAAPTTK